MSTHAAAGPAITYPRRTWYVPATADHRASWAAVNRYGTVIYYETQELAMWSD